MRENKHIFFQKVGDTGKTEVWDVVSYSSLDGIARISWYSPWRQYVVAPAENTVWNDGCLESVIAFLQELNADHKANLVPAQQKGEQR